MKAVEMTWNAVEQRGITIVTWLAPWFHEISTLYDLQTRLRTDIQTRRKGNVVIDLAKADVIQGNGVLFLSEVGGNCLSQSGKLIVCQTKPSVREFIEKVGIGERVTIATDQVAAIKLCGS